MSSYRGLGPVPIIPSAAMSGTAVIYSQIFDIGSLEGAAFQPIWSGTPTGTLKVLVSLDYQPNPQPGGTARNAGTWSDLGASFTNQPAGGANSTYCPVYASCAKYIKLQYTNASGSGVLSGYFVGKSRG